jgi:hypothetical protein
MLAPGAMASSLRPNRSRNMKENPGDQHDIFVGFAPQKSNLLLPIFSYKFDTVFFQARCPVSAPFFPTQPATLLPEIDFTKTQSSHRETEVLLDGRTTA